MPSYLCDSLIQSANAAKTEIFFYKLNSALQMEGAEWLKDIRIGDVVLYIDYFGFPFESDWIENAKKRGARVVRDASQALLSNGGNVDTDFVILSPRKFLGVPDGGVLFAADDIDTARLKLISPPDAWIQKSIKIIEARERFDRGQADNDWFNQFRELEREFPIGPFAMSPISRELLECNFDYGVVAQKRRENYEFLLKNLGNYALFPHIDAGVVPLGFPVVVENRDRMRDYLFAQKIFPPVHWEISEIVPKSYQGSHKLARSIMTLPCDQRYDASDMRRIVTHFRGALDL